MTRIPLALTLALLPLLASLPAQAHTPHCQRASHTELLELFGQWNDALQSGDAAEVARLYQDDAVLLPTLSATPRLTPEARLDYFRELLHDSPTSHLDSHEVQGGCNEATAAGLYTFDFSATGQRLAARYTFTYRWDGQRWLISQHHSSMLPRG